MEKIIDNAMLYSFIFGMTSYIMKYHKDIFYRTNNKQYKLYDDDIDNIYEEINMLKGELVKAKEAIRNIIKKLPFNGEEWMREFILEEIDKNIMNAPPLVENNSLPEHIRRDMEHNDKIIKMTEEFFNKPILPMDCSNLINNK